MTDATHAITAKGLRPGIGSPTRGRGPRRALSSVSPAHPLYTQES